MTYLKRGWRDVACLWWKCL